MSGSLIVPVGTSLDEIERVVLLLTLRLNGGNKARAARELGRSRRWVYNKILDYEARGVAELDIVQP